MTLASGREADYYVDMRRVTLDAVAAPVIGRVMLELTADWDYDAVGGLTLGADPIAVGMLHQAAAAGRTLEAFVVRKAQKAHGLQKQIEGPDVAGRRVLAVEDTSTTGGSVLEAVAALRAAGAEVVGVAVIVDRDTGARALRCIVEELMNDIMFELPDIENKGKYQVTAEVVRGEKPLFEKKPDKKSA